MRISVGHRNLVAQVAFGLGGMLGFGVPVGAEPVVAPTSTQTPADAADSSPWPALAQGPATPAGETEGRKMNAASARLVPELFTRDPLAPPPSAGRVEKTLLPGGTAATELSISPAQVTEHQPLSRELARTVKEAVRPVYEELADSGILDVIRSLESELGLESRRSFKDPASNHDSPSAGSGAPAESVSWGRPANPSESYSRAQSPAQRKDDPVRARNLLGDFFEELKPWAYTLVGLYVLGYMVKLGLDYNRVRAARRRRRLATGTRHKRRRHHHRKDKHGAGKA